MRDKRFVAVHRGGQLTRANHRQLMKWARICSEHVLNLLEENIDKRLVHALHISKEWENEKASTGEAMKASISAHTVARESSNAVSIAVARSVGHAVATAHMADHSLGAALYALKAVKLAAKSVSEEKDWQKMHLQQLPSEIIEVVVLTMIKKQNGLNFK